MRILAALLSGLLLTASQPPGNVSWLAWIALIPLLTALEGQPGPARFKLGFLAGTVHFLTLIYWVVVVLREYGGLNTLISVSVLIAFTLYLSLYVGFFGLLFSITRGRLSVVLLPAASWIALEYARGWLLTGFPWCLLGHTQAQNLRLIQISDLTGVHGISFLICSVNVLLFTLVFDFKKKHHTGLLAEGCLVILLLALALSYGHSRLDHDFSRASVNKPLRVGAIQANIDQSRKWRPSFQDATLDTYRSLSAKAATQDLDLLVWPETSLPFFFQDTSEKSARIYSIARDIDADLLFGSPAYERSGNRINYYNRAYLLGKDVGALVSYDKVHLVPFGEYVPMKKLLFFVGRLVPAAGDFKAGGKIAPLSGDRYSAGVLICFEAIFPELARAHALQGANVLVNLTNDAWFGPTSAPYQHLAMTVFRAVESRLPVVRAANTGISAFIEPTGRIKKSTELFEKAAISADVYPSSNPTTFYTRHGDLFSFFLLFLVSAKLVGFIINRQKNKRV